MTTTYSGPARFFSLFRILAALGAVGAQAARDAAPRMAVEPARYVSTRFPPCCARATEIVGCVCAVAYQCPTHGESHHGTHD